MKLKTNYINTSDAIQGYSNSEIAKKEKNDCVVRAVASSFDISYDNSHSFVQRVLGRKPKHGTNNTVEKLKGLQKKSYSLNNKFFSLMEGIYVRKEGKVERKLTVGKFIQNYGKGTYMVFVKGHAFTVKNGSVIGNTEDAVKLKKRVYSVFEITQ